MPRGFSGCFSRAVQLLVVVLPCAGLAVGPSSAAPAEPPTYQQTSRVVLGGEGGWDYLNADGEANRLYISRGTRVDVVDLKKLAVIGHIDNTPGVHGIALAKTAGKGYTSNGGDNTVTIFDLATLQQVARVPVGNRPDAICYDNVSKRVFTFNGGSKDSTAIDIDTGQVAGTIPLGGRPEFAGSDDHGHVYVNIEDTSEVAEIDSKSLKVTNRWSIAPGDGPSGIAVDGRHHRVFSVCGNQMMTVLDTTTGKVIATPAIGRGPDAAAFDPRNQLAFSSNGEGTITVVHEMSPTNFMVMQTVTTEPGARTMALDEKTHVIYLVTAKVIPPPPGTEQPRYRRNYEPGSFALLVVSPVK